MTVKIIVTSVRYERDRSRPLRLNKLLALETFVNDNVTFLILMKSLVAIIISKIDCTN